jgi:hypothetical protein
MSKPRLMVSKPGVKVREPGLKGDPKRLAEGGEAAKPSLYWMKILPPASSGLAARLAIV